MERIEKDVNVSKFVVFEFLKLTKCYQLLENIFIERINPTNPPMPHQNTQ